MDDRDHEVIRPEDAFGFGADTGAPALTALRRAPLPTPATRLVGRQREVAEVAELVPSKGSRPWRRRPESRRARPGCSARGESQLAAVGMFREQLEGRIQKRVREEVAVRLGSEWFAADWAAGASLGFEDAVALGLAGF